MMMGCCNSFIQILSLFFIASSGEMVFTSKLLSALEAIVFCSAVCDSGISGTFMLSLIVLFCASWTWLLSVINSWSVLSQAIVGEVLVSLRDG